MLCIQLLNIVHTSVRSTYSLIEADLNVTLMCTVQNPSSYSIVDQYHAAHAYTTTR